MRTGSNKLILGILIGICLPIAAFYIFLKLGGMPVATKGKPFPFERFIAKTALHKAMDDAKVEEMISPVAADELNFTSGAKVYSVNCAVCHGVPGGKPTAIAAGLFPKVPQLFGNHGVTDDPVGEIYWKVKNGIRLTGMPGFVDTLSDTEMWQVSELLLHADKLPASVTLLLTGPAPAEL